MWACGPAPKAVETPKPDPTKEQAYIDAVAELQGLAREADEQFRTRKFEAASAAITKAQPLVARLLGAPQPPLAAMQAASDLDDIYGQMLMANRHYGWARLAFQKNAARWKNWRPETEDSRRRLKQAEEAIAEVDRRLAK